MKTTVACILFSLAAASCASTRAVPNELSQARAAYGRAAAAPGAPLVMVDVYKAEKSLKKAEAAWEEDASDVRVLDHAYVAQREAEVAEALGEAALDKKEQAAAEKEITETYAAAAGHKLRRATEASKKVED